MFNNLIIVCFIYLFSFISEPIMSDTEGDRDTRKKDESVSHHTGLMEGHVYNITSSAIKDASDPSLQELIEAELSARLAPLQPDSLEDTIGSSPPDSLDPVINNDESNHYDSLDENSHKSINMLETKMTLIEGALDPLKTLNSTLNGHNHITSIVNSSSVNTSSLITCDSLEAQNYSLDSLADVESGVDVASPNKVASVGDASPSSPISLDASSDLPNSLEHISNSPVEPLNGSSTPTQCSMEFRQHLTDVNGFASSDESVNNTVTSSDDHAIPRNVEVVTSTTGVSQCAAEDQPYHSIHVSNSSEHLSAYHVTNNVSWCLVIFW